MREDSETEFESAHWPDGPILVFGRRRNFDRMLEVARELFPGGTRFDLWSGERYPTGRVRWWGNVFYCRYEALAERSVGEMEAAAPFTLDEFIGRCRYLRQLETGQAARIALASYATWRQILEDRSYAAIVSLPVDSYVLDGLAYAARETDVPFVSPVGTVFSGRIRFTIRGNLLGSLPLEGERATVASQARNALTQTEFRPDWLIGVDTGLGWTVLRRMFIHLWKPLAFAAYRLLMRDPLSFSFAPLRVLRKLMMATPARALETLRLERRASAADFPDRFALIPLQFYPEVASDYWISELEMCNHHRVVLAVARALAPHIPVVVKEHPAAAGRRDANVLRALREIRGVTFAPTLSPMGELVRRASLVVGYGSSTMFQALVMGTPTLFTGSPFYGSAGNPVVKRLDSKELIAARADEAMKEGQDAEAVDAVFERYFRSTAAGQLGSPKILGENEAGAPDSVSLSKECRRLLKGALENTPIAPK